MAKLPIPISPSIPMDPSALINKYLDYAKSREQEITKRQAISAWRDTEIERIKAEKDILLDYLNKEYKERANVYEKAFSALDKGIDKGDVTVIQTACAIILQQISKNPFPSLQEFCQQRSRGEALDF